MFTVFKDFSFSAAHQIRGHQGGCQNLHGHNYRVRVFVRARELDALGMVIDFADLKNIRPELRNDPFAQEASAKRQQENGQKPAKPPP